MTFKYKITLFTPTYNRAYILDTLYRSVQRQTFRDFEWIIMDDGSSDNTEELVKGWMEEPGGLQSMGSLRVGHDRATSLYFHFHAL